MFVSGHPAGAGLEVGSLAMSGAWGLVPKLKNRDTIWVMYLLEVARGAVDLG